MLRFEIAQCCKGDAKLAFTKRGQEQNEEELEMAQKKLVGGRNSGKK